MEDAVAAPQSAVHRIEFRGGAVEYFKIWAVNVALTVLTLGVFSAWAKVRTKRYFYANTFLDGANFEYHARPLSILVARIFVIAVVIGGGYLADIYLPFSPLYTLLLLLFVPWALVRGLSFNARNSSYRNVRFAFRRGYGMPYLLYVSMSFFIGVFLLPWLIRGYHSFKIGRHRIGVQSFVFNKAPISPYIFALWVLPFVFFLIVLALSITYINFPSGFNGDYLQPLFMAVSLPLVLFIFFYGQAILFSMFWRNIKTENGAVIKCNFSEKQFAAVLLVNFIATSLSFGLLYPWAKVRKTRFLANRMQIIAPPNALDEIFARRGEDEGALGEEFDAAEGFDFDAGLV